MEDRNELIQWIKEHKKQLIVAGISTGTLFLIILGFKNRSELRAIWESLERVVKHPTSNTTEEAVKVIGEISLAPSSEIVTSATLKSETIPFEVSRHVRNLPDGWQASSEKIAEAMKYNITLKDGQTWVESYMKGGAVA